MTNRCHNCDARLAHDQRYCLECGERRGELPAYVWKMLAGIRGDPGFERGPVLVEPSLGGDDADEEPRSGGWVPRPSFAMIAALGMMAFGAEIGAAVGASPIVSLAAAPLIVLHNELAPGTSPTTVASTGGGGGGGGAPGGGSSGGGSPASSSGGQSSSQAISTGSTTTSSTSTVPANKHGLPSIGHVFLIVLSNEGYAQTFGSRNHYLAATLPKQGKLVENYYAVAGGELANEIALISGQGPTPQTLTNCSRFANVSPGAVGRHGQVLGHGCVYPKKARTLAGQLTTAHLTWRAYIQGMASSLPGQPQVCRHPAIGKFDTSQIPQLTDPYTTWRNPFVYFHSVIDAKSCASDDVDLTQLSSDLKSASSTPSLSYIAPDACDDGSPQPCTAGAPAGIGPMDKFLRTVVPEIEASPAYKAGGLIMITFDQAQQTGPRADQSSCCSTPKYPNVPATSTSGPSSAGTSTTPSSAFATADIVGTTTSGSTTSGSTTSETGTSSTGTSSTSTTATTTTSTTGASATATGTSSTGTTATTTTGTTTTGTTGASTTAATTTTGTSTTGARTTTTGTTTAATTTPQSTTPATTTTGTSTTGTTTTTSSTTTPSLGGGQTSPTGGGGHVGMLLISPWIKPATVDVFDYYNHFSLLASLEEIFNLKRLGYAGQPGLPAFGAGLFDGSGPAGG